MDLPIRYKKAQYPEITEKRRPDRAKVWLVTWSELLKIAPELKDFWLDIHNTLDLAEENEDMDTKEIFEKIAQHLQKKYSDLRRGDMIYLQPELGYRNEGIYIYDGEKIQRLTADIIDYGHIPGEFEVITEFPIHYWDGRNHHNDLVYFDVNSYFPDLTLEDIDGFPDENGLMRPYFYFENDEGEGYYILSQLDLSYEDIKKTSNSQIYRAFLKELQKTEFFNSGNDDISLSASELEEMGTDADHVLYLTLNELDLTKEDQEHNLKRRL